jgi:hypothetical protein
MFWILDPERATHDKHVSANRSRDPCTVFAVVQTLTQSRSRLVTATSGNSGTLYFQEETFYKSLHKSGRARARVKAGQVVKLSVSGNSDS